MMFNSEPRPLAVAAKISAGGRVMVSKRRFMRRAASCALLAGYALTVLQAGTAAAQQNNSASTSAGDEQPPLQEIVISARRKDERLTDVPVSVTAMSSDFLEKQNIQSFADYATKIPNLTFQYGQGSDGTSVGFSGGRQTTIRGVTGTNTTAYYLNDTPIPETVSPQTLGLERIEVLKGPQGTLFGASSMGGNVRFITKKPSLTNSESSVQVQAGGTDGGSMDVGGNALTNVVITPGKVAMNFAAGAQRDSGYIKRVFPDAGGNPVTRDGQGRQDDFSGMTTLRVQLTEDLEASLTAMGEVSELHGFPAAYVPLPDFKPVSYTVHRDRDVQEYSKDHWGLGSLVLTYNGNGYSVVSSTSYFDRKVRELEDDTEGTNQYFQSGLGINLPNDPALYVIDIVQDKRVTQESRISFDEGTLLPHLSGVAGVFYQEKDVTFRQPPVQVPDFITAGLPQDYQNSDTIPTQEENIAAFGELYYEVVPKLTVTLGLRQYWITQHGDAHVATGVVNPPDGAYAPELNNYQSGLVPKGVVSYKIDDDAMVYASAAKGFRVGGAQAPLPAFCAADLAAIGVSAEKAQRYQPDSLWSYEVGAKDRLADGRLNISVAGFQIDWSQVQQQVQLPQCSYSFLTNAGRAQIRGGELELSGRPFADIPLTLQLGLGYTDAVLQDPGLIPQAPDTRLTQVPRWTGTVSGYYETPINASTDLFVAADYSYTGSVLVPNIGADGFLRRQPFNIVNGNIGVRFGGSTLSVYGKNLLNEHLNYGNLYPSGFVRQQFLPNGTSQSLPMAAVSRPRQIGIQYKVDF
ncbi:TonB-dependent receptor [Nitrospirillum viridazoti]|uniref:TonB-dependent receptor n=1 Tax=Nitrospirillum viridazoti CBAmc TaxID=1441467 RepID=A0A248JUN9_9PROT|nr:TonB-dependent receptor [Nitrospirillum amazonense]ASG22319.1 TonB-dependent receptor [Nitrospirillum amazonense CBAmc]TWB43152.1 outer membrane receptor protein involved in Fe transport [Nitrospirillum amazonense]